nr:HnRNP A1 family member (hrp 1) [Hymenolepis microstoma]
MKAVEKLGKEARDFMLKNESVEISFCTSCQRPNCNVCELCKHCDRYLCHQCATSHKAMYSSVLFSHLLKLQLRYKHYVDRRAEVKSKCASDATERLQRIIEGALLRAEICLESLEILLNDQSSEVSTKLTEITGLFGSSEGNRDLSKRLSKTASEIRNGESETSCNLPLNVQSFVNKYQKASTVPKREVPSYSMSFRTSSLTRNIIPTQTSNLLGQSEVTISASNLSTNGTALSSEASQLIATSRCIRIQRLGKRYSKTKSTVIPTENEIKAFFQKFGIVERIRMKPSNPNGFVIFSNKTEAQDALSAPVHSVNGCCFKVIPSRQIPETEKVAATSVSEKWTSKGILYFQAHVKQSKVALPTMDEIEEYFRQFGKVVEVILRFDPPCGYVIFDDVNSAKNSLAVIDHSVRGCKVTVREASEISLILKDKSDCKCFA